MCIVFFPGKMRLLGDLVIILAGVPGVARVNKVRKN